MRSLALVALAACTGPVDTEPADDTDAPVVYDDDLGATCPAMVDPLPAAPRPVASFPFLPTSNGIVAAQFVTEAQGVPVTFADGRPGTATQKWAITAWSDHLPQRPTEATWARDLMWDAFPGVIVDGTPTWLGGVAASSVGYEPGTGIVVVEHRVGDVIVTSRWFAPFQAGGDHDLVGVFTVKNGGTTAHTVTLASLTNAHTGGEGRADGEGVTADGAAIVEGRGSDVIRHTPLGEAARAAAPAGDGRNPWVRVQGGAALGGDLVGGNDVAVGFTWALGSLAPGAEATRGVVTSWGHDAAALGARVGSFVGSRDAAAILAAERAEWDAWHAVESPPAGLSDDERAVWRQSTAVLRMAQVREAGPGQGQILASLPPGNWNIAWPRDGAYAAVGLVASGHADEAKAFLDFVIHAEAGAYAGLLGIDDYLVSACRYTGDGVEESDGAGCPDGSDAGPNVELDDFGLFLWAYAAYAKARPDDPWLAETRATVAAGVADPLVALIDGNRDLLVPDSSIWERHWDTCFPNGRKRFAYSSIQAAAGLRDFAQIHGDAAYEAAGARIRRGLLRDGEDGGPIAWEGDCPFVASAPEEICVGCGPYDASVIEIVNHGLVRPESAVAIGTARAMRGALAMPHWPGFRRNDDGTGTTNPYPWYDDQEWVVIDLRMAEAYRRIGDATGDATFRDDADVIFGWVTAQARANHDLIPELLSDGTWTAEDDADRVRPGVDLGAEFQGAVPMAGFGPGAYLITAEVLR